MESEKPATLNELEVVAARHGVTDAGKRLLAVKADPKLRTTAVTRQCEIADISRTAYYDLVRDQRFLSALRELAVLTLVEASLPAAQTVAKLATEGDLVAAKMVLEMAGLYNQSVSISASSGPPPLSLADIIERRKEAEITVETAAV